MNKKTAAHEKVADGFGGHGNKYIERVLNDT